MSAGLILENMKLCHVQRGGIRKIRNLIELIDRHISGWRVSTSGMRLTIVAHVCSTVAGLTTWNSTSGSPSIFQSHISPSSGPYTLPIQAVSNVMPD